MLNADLLRKSFDLVATVAPDLTERFYAMLFDRHPELRPMFGSSTKAQADMLGRALVAVLEHVEDEPWLARTLGALGAKHVAYGVTTEHFAIVGAVLLDTLKAAAGEAWTSEIAAAWAEAYAAIADLMLAGMHAAPDAVSKRPSFSALPVTTHDVRPSSGSIA